MNEVVSFLNPAADQDFRARLTIRPTRGDVKVETNNAPHDNRRRFLARSRRSC